MKIVTRVSIALLLVVMAAEATAAEGSEICRFRALDAENPFRRWLASQEVTCVAAGAPVEFPPGLWNVFVREAGRVSTEPFLVDGDAEPASIAPPLVAAAFVTPLLPQGHTAVIYIPRRASALPVDGARVVVPADEPLWLFVLDQSSPVALIPIAPIAAGKEASVDARSGGPAAVIGWLQVPQPDRTAVAAVSGVSNPTIHAGSRDADLLPSPLLLHGAFFRIRDVEPGAAEVRVDGRGWVPDRRVVRVQPGLTVAAAPLRLRATGTLAVHWNTHQDLVALDRSVGACKDDDAPRLTIVVSKCPSAQRIDEADCAEVREEQVDVLFGSTTFDDVVPGTYRAEMRFGKLPPASGWTSVGPLKVADLRMFAHYDTVYGSVTRGGEPLGEDVRIRFPGGVGYAVADSEDYAAVFRPPPIGPEARIDVVACDGSPRNVVLTDAPMRPRTRFNIDIPANELVVHVNDTFTREALPGATVKFDAISVLRPPRVVFSTTGTANEQGDAAWTGVPVRTLHLTVTHAGYEKRVIDSFTMEKSGTRTVDVQLVPLRGTQGKIVSDRPFAGAVAVWFSPAGSETERADVAADGTFVYANQHTADETMAVVSASHPLWVFRSPATGGREGLSVRFPDAPVAAFDVWRDAVVPPNEARHVGVIIGGVRVPQPVLAQHQTLRRESSLLRGRGPLTFRDLLATGPIDVLLGPTDPEVATRARALDLFALPQFAAAPRQRVEPGATDVVFPGAVK